MGVGAGFSHKIASTHAHANVIISISHNKVLMQRPLHQRNVHTHHIYEGVSKSPRTMLITRKSLVVHEFPARVYNDPRLS